MRAAIVANAQLLQFREPTPGAGEDESNLSAARNGDVLAFESLYRRHVARIYALCLRMTGQPALAEDCTQECFISAWRALAAFKAQSSLSTWLHRIAVNAVLGQRRRGQSDLARLALPIDAAALAVTDNNSAGETADIEAALARLPPGARDVVVLVGLYGHSHEEAAEFLGIATGTSKAQLHRGRRLLAAQLGLA